MARGAWRDRARSLGRKLVRVLAGLAILALGAGFAGAAWEALEQRVFERNFQPPGDLIHIGDRRLHIVCAGAGEPGVLLISGMGGSFAAWGPFQERIARFARVCAYDRAGLGWSDPADTPRTAGAAARDLEALLASAAPFDEPPVIVGHSIGGLYAHRFARVRPDRVGGLVLIDPTTEELYDSAANWRSDAVLRFLWPALGRLGVMRLRFRHDHADLEPDSLDELTGVASGYPATRALAREYSGLDGSFAKADRAHERSLDEPPMDFDGPVIVLSARRSTAPTSAGQAERARVRRASHTRLADDASDGQMIELEAGHYIHRERPDTVIAVIRTLIEQLHGTADSAASR